MKMTPAADVPPAQVAPTRTAATQTTGNYTLSEADLVRFLTEYEYLYEQEQWAKEERSSHERALRIG